MIFEIIALLVLGGIAKAIAADVRRKAEGEYQKFIEKSREYERQIAAAEREIEREIQCANAELVGEQIQLHHRSMLLANQAKGALDHARRTLDALWGAYKEVRQNQERLSREYAEFRESRDWAKVEEIKQDQASLKNLKTALHDQIEEINGKVAEFRESLTRLNMRTGELKLHIRDSGHGGRIWYERLEARSAARRAERDSR